MCELIIAVSLWQSQIMHRSYERGDKLEDGAILIYPITNYSFTNLSSASSFPPCFRVV